MPPPSAAAAAERQGESPDGRSRSDAGPSMTPEKRPANATTTNGEQSATATASSANAPSEEGGTRNDKPAANRTDAPEQPTENGTAVPKIAKIRVHLVAVGSAPILKRSKFLMGADDRFAVAVAFLARLLGPAAQGSTPFLYVGAAFVPAPDGRMGDLFECFGSRGELVIHYSLQEAWG